MNFRVTTILFGVMLALGLVLLGLSFLQTDSTGATDVLVEELAKNAVKPEQITEVVLERGNGTRLKFVRSGKDRWDIVEPHPARADSIAVTGVINALFRAKPVASGDLTLNKAAHGLEPPSLRVTLSQGSEHSSTVNLGDVTLGGSKAIVFVTTSARSERPMAVARPDLEVLFKSTKDSGPAGDLAKWIGDYQAKSVFSIGSRSVGGPEATALKITLPNKGKELAISRSGADWKFDSPAGWGDVSPGATPNPASVGLTGASQLLNSIVDLKAQSADDFISEPKDLKEYGLDAGNPDLIRIEIKAKDGPPEVAYIGKKAEAAPPAPSFPGAPPPAAKVYVRVEGVAGVIRATPGAGFDELAAVVTDPTVLRDRDLIKEDLQSRIDAVDVIVGSQTVKLRKAPGSTEWKLYGGPNDPQIANQTTITNLLGLVTQPRIIKDFPATTDANFTPPETKAEVKLWVDGIETNTDAKADAKAEPKLKGTPIVLQFGKKGPTGVYVRRTLANGTKTDFLLPEKVKVGKDFADTDVATAVSRTRLDYVNADLKGFALTQANRLTITAGPKVTEVIGDKNPSPGFPVGKWTFALPAERKGVVADADLIRGDLLNNLATEKPIQLVAEQPSDAELVKFGLDPKAPRLKVVVGLDVGPPPPTTPGAPPAPDTEKERTYYFGNETDDHQSVYARQDGKAMVFTVSKSLFDKLASTDLQDKTIVRFEVAKVKKVKIRGWREKSGRMLTTEVERQGGTGKWVAIDPPGASIDPSKVDSFLQDIRNLKVKEYLAPGRRLEHHFPPEDAGFEITLELDGAPGVLLNIAAPADGGASRFAALGSPPHEALFTVSDDALKTYRDDVGLFLKRP